MIVFCRSYLFKMSVSCEWDPAQRSYQVYWRCHGQKQIRIPCSLFAGDEEVTKRVAERLKNYVHNCADRSDKETFVGVLNRFVAEVTREISLAPDEANETSDQLIATELGNSKTQSTAPLAQTAAQDTIGSAVVASDAVTSSVWGICEPLVPLPAMPLCPAAAAVHMKATLKVFVEQTAAGHKFWECSVRSGMFNRVRAGDLLILTQTQSKGMVVAVGEIANGPIHRESRREALYSRMPPHLRRSVEEYLGTATAFDYVQFSQVFDVRRNRMNFKDLLAKGLFEDPGLPWCNGLLTAKATSASSMVGLRDFLATHGVVRACQDGVDVE